MPHASAEIVAQVDPRTLGENLYLLIGLFVVLVLVVVLLLAGWTSIKVWIWRSRKKRAERERQRLKYRADGQPYPPSGRGLCDRCEQSYEKIYFLPTGQRLCPTCYEDLYER